MESDVIARVATCERTNRKLKWLLSIQFAGLCLCAAALVAIVLSGNSGKTFAASPKSLRVRQLVVVDRQGVARVRISGDLPDAIIHGKRAPRGNKAAGVLLYDATGQERSGYVTWEPSGNVGLTLDTKSGQVALLVAGPESGTVLKLWHANDSVELRSDEDGSRLTAVRAGGVVIQEPKVSISTETCNAYREIASRLSQDRSLQACRGRFTSAPCTGCLSK